MAVPEGVSAAAAPPPLSVSDHVVLFLFVAVVVGIGGPGTRDVSARVSVARPVALPHDQRQSSVKEEEEKKDLWVYKDEHRGNCKYEFLHLRATWAEVFDWCGGDL